MKVTDTNLKALSECTGSQLLDCQSRKILLDECVTINFGKNKTIDTSIHCSKVLVGRGAKDYDVMRFAKNNGYMVVTADKGLIIRCMKHNVPVAWYHNNKVHVLAVSETFEIPYQIKGAPIKVKKAKLKPKPSFWAKLAGLLR